MTAPGATFSDTPSLDTITCRLCRHVITLDPESASLPRRCPSCKAWLAVRQPALLRKVSEQTAPGAPHARTDQDDRERPERVIQHTALEPELSPSPKGWRAVSKASLFHRFDTRHTAVTQPDLPPRHMPEPVDEPAAPPRRELSFEFAPPAHREPPEKQVVPIVLRDEMARREHVDTSDEDAIEAWLDIVESEVSEVGAHASEPLFTDVSFDAASIEPVSKLIDLDAFEVHREARDEPELVTLELEREPERFELQLGDQHIGPLDRDGVNALIVSGLDAHALVRCEGQQRWDPIAEHDAFAELYALTAPSEDDEDLTVDDVPPTPGVEVDELDSETVIIEPEEQGQTLLGMQREQENVGAEEDEVDEVRGDTLMMFVEGASQPPVAEPVESPQLPVEVPEEVPSPSPALALGDEEKEEAVAQAPAVTTAPQAERAEVALEVAAPIVAAPAPRRSVWRTVAGVMGMLVVFALGSLVGAVIIESRTAPEDGPGARSAKELLETMIMLPRERATYQAVRGARTVVHLSSNQKFMTPERQRDVALELAASQDHAAALKVFGVLWQNESARSPAIGLAMAKSARAQGRHDLARQVLIDAATLSPEPEMFVQITAAFNTSISEDEALHPPVMTLEPDVHLDVARALGGGKSISLKFTKDGETRYAFKPSQIDWAEGWRAEVAAYLLCEAISCHFEVPRSLPARISREDFDELYGRFTSTKQTTYAEQFAERLIWVKEPGPDGVEREYLYGVMKDWMPGFVDFPIEYGDIWDDWLDAKKDPSVMNRDLRDALSALRFRQNGKYFAPVMDERRGATTREVARGISDILVFDYVTSNWDRYSGVETYYGVNNQFDEGKFLSLDNGAAFHILTQRKVEQRFEPVTRFSRSTIAALRMLEPEHTDDILFPEPGQEARQRLEVFWAQRDRLLVRVDELVQAHGKQSVLYFD